MKNTSIKTRVTLCFFFTMVILATLFFSVMTLHRTAQVKQTASENLSRHVNAAAAAIVDNQSVTMFDSEKKRSDFPGEKNKNKETDIANPPPLHNGTPAPRTYSGGVHIAVYDQNGNNLFGQNPFLFQDTLFQNNEIRKITSENETFYVLDKTVTLNDGSVYWVKGVNNVTPVLDGATATIWTDYFLILGLITIASVGGYFIVGWALRPITKMRKTAKNIADSGSLTQRIQIGEGKDEVYALAAVFNEMLDKIESAFQTEKQFTSDASHELRTPVAVILSECEYAEDCITDPADYKESVSVIRRQAEKMSHLISELLTISRMDRAYTNFSAEPFDVSELAEIVCEEQSEIGQKNITLNKDLQKNILLTANGALITRLMVNLISNAYTYGKENGTINVQLSCRNNQIIFCVEDDGIGISAENLPKIWDRFYQANPSRSNNGNMGLGLSMVKQIAELHHGTAEVTSAEGVGSVFTVTLPLTPPE